MKNRHGIKRGFTLIELLVVVTILGLLAIVVLPAFTAGGDKRLLRGAAERLDTHFKHAAARATGKSRGSAVWLDAGTGTAVFDLNFARMPTGAPLSRKVDPGGSSTNFAVIDPAIDEIVGSVVKFDMSPLSFDLHPRLLSHFRMGKIVTTLLFQIAPLRQLNLLFMSRHPGHSSHLDQL